ncbi:MAG TPA: efflux RND transporter periplasmic adaptor subunit, partial [Bacteroidia bacterium]|nr:efflux RND transporter periplasmic adaptor subunit [Bacteroidia bacterium]
IEKKAVVVPFITVYSKTDGYLSSLHVQEGQYVNAGDVLFETASLDHVRVNAQIYPGEINTFENATEFEVETVSGEIFTAQKLPDVPSLEVNSKIQLIQLRVANPAHHLHPGMMMSIKATSGAAQKCLLIPRSALITEDQMPFIWILEKDGMFSRRMIVTGREDGDLVEVVSGISAGDQIVISGTYLLNSEYVLRNGSNSMAGMKM